MPSLPIKMEDFVLGDAICRRDESRLYKVDGM